MTRNLATRKNGKQAKRESAITVAKLNDNSKI